MCANGLQAAEVSSSKYSVIAADKGHVVRYDKTGKAEWEFKGAGSAHCLKQLPNGNLLTQLSWTHIVELNPAGEIVWEYDSGKMNGNEGKRIEVHAFQRLDNGLTMIVENGVGRIIEVDRDGVIKHSTAFKVSKPNAHRDCRQARKLENGNYLLCHEGDGRVTEYSPSGEIVWDYNIPLFGKEPAQGHGPEAWGNQCYNALRLTNGNTLIATGNGHSVIEVTPKKEIVWHLAQHDLPGITLAWITSLEVLPGGNMILGNCHAGPDNPQLIEVNRDKKVVWTFKDFDLLGDATAASATVGVDGVLR
ncbi:MAG: hypothetical protein H6824_22550 [Planctomycetaceae bacterium]|nr:hypothetical protein [Planctomycetaceae bacterium]